MRCWWSFLARHADATGYDGNPMGEFRASIGDDEYGQDVTLEAIGLYSRQYISFRPGE
jgi:hypothetical protein